MAIVAGARVPMPVFLPHSRSCASGELDLSPEAEDRELAELVHSIQQANREPIEQANEELLRDKRRPLFDTSEESPEVEQRDFKRAAAGER